MKEKKYKKKINGKNDTGAPDKYILSYCKQAEKWLADGYSLDSFAGKIGVSQQTIWNWVRAHKEFLESVKVGRAKGILYWERMAHNATSGTVTGRKTNVTMLQFQLKNRIGWKDKIDVYQKDLLDEITEHEIEQDGNSVMSGTIKDIIKKYGKSLTILDIVPNR